MAGAGTFASNDNQIYYPATTQTLYGTGGIAFLDIGGFSYMVGNLSYNVGWVNSSNGYTGSPNPFIPGYGEASGGGAAAETVALDGFSLSPAMGAPGPVPGGGLLSGAFLCLGAARSLWRRRRRGPMALEPHIRADGNGHTQTEGPGFSASPSAAISIRARCRSKAREPRRRRPARAKRDLARGCAGF